LDPFGIKKPINSNEMKHMNSSPRQCTTGAKNMRIERTTPCIAMTSTDAPALSRMAGLAQAEKWRLFISRTTIGKSLTITRVRPRDRAGGDGPASGDLSEVVTDARASLQERAR
jgi:hypothetical protein